MSRDTYDGRGSQRFDSDRFTRETVRYDDGRDSRGADPGLRERETDEVYERRVSGPRSYEDDRFRERRYYEDDEPRYRPRREPLTIEKETEREVYRNPSPPRRAPARPGLIRRQSSLDTFDRVRFPPYRREEYGPPARREDFRPAYVPPPPRSRADAYEREFEEIKISDPDYYGDEDYRPYPERIREREVIRARRRSRSRSRSRSRDRRSSARSLSSSSSSSSEIVFKQEKKKFPKRGKTRMPARLVSIKAISDLGYPYELEGNVVVIQKALGPENIDDVIKLSESYKKSEKVEMSGGRSPVNEVIEERREEIITTPPYLTCDEVVEKRIVERRQLSPPRVYYGRSRSADTRPIIVDAPNPIEIVERSNDISVGPLIVLDKRKSRDDRSIRAEIRALEAERDALKVERIGSLELAKVDLIRREGREGGEVVVYEERVRREREPDGGVEVRVVRDKKAGRARALSTMLKTLT